MSPRLSGSVTTLAVALVIGVVAVATAAAQTAPAQAPVRVRVVRATVVMETPRGDSVVLGRLAAGVVLERLQESGRWIEVTPAQGTTGITWRRGWIPQEDVEYLDAPPPAARTSSRTRAAQRPPGEFMIRGFGQYGGTLFTAGDSIEAILDTTLGAVYGGGAQLVFPNGLFVQGGIDRFRKTGSRAIVSDTQVFRTDIPNTVTITPLLATVGYRDPRGSRLTGYGGAGIGWHRLEEQSPALAASGDHRESHFGYHFSGGAEYRVLPFLWFAGEVQWASVPDALEDAGIGTAFDESDLGGTTFRFKIIIGR